MAMRFASPRRLTVVRRIMFIPAITTVLMLLMVVAAERGAVQGTGALRGLDRDVFEPLHQALRLKDGVTQIHTGLAMILFRHVTELDQQATLQAGEALPGRLDEVAAVAARLRAAMPPALIPAMEPVDRALGQYLASARDTLGMAGADLAWADIMMVEADERFQGLRDSLDRLVEDLSVRRKTLAEKAIGRSARAEITLIVLAVAASTLALLASALIARGVARQYRLFETALGSMAQGLAMFDRAGGLVVANPALARLFGLGGIAPGLRIAELLDGPLSHVVSRTSAALVLDAASELQRCGHAGEITCELTDGRAVLLNLQPSPEAGLLVTFEDITERRRTDARISHLAHHDALTGLPNRVLFRKRVEEAATRFADGEDFAVHYLDLDHFKEVNDTLGHPVGDALLRSVALRLRHVVRDTDTVARLGGDEFAILETRVSGEADTAALAARVIACLSTPFDIEGHVISIGTSVGIALASSGEADPDRLLRNADLALYCAKGEGRGQSRCFTPEMRECVQARRDLDRDLKRAIAADEFEPFFQPLMDLGRSRVGGFEALVRWRHPERGLVPPDQFIPQAEQSGLIVAIGAQVLRRACAEARGWLGERTLAVNLSPEQLRDRTLPALVAEVLAETGLPPHRLELEITETAMVKDVEETVATLQALKALGVRIALDDFGTGYSSLSYLQRFPFDKVKIDRSFVRDVGRREDCTAIIRAVIGLCRNLRALTTAEGVETPGQLAWLQAEGCTQAQGYLFSPPRPADEIPSLIARLEAMQREVA